MATSRGPREMADPSNLPYRSAGVFINTDKQSSNKYNLQAVMDGEEANSSHNRSASVKVKKMTRIYDGSTKFPRLEECAHFHYEVVELGRVKLVIKQEEKENACQAPSEEPSEKLFNIQVHVNDKSWWVKRNYENLRVFDKQLHRCIYDRKYSQLPELRKTQLTADNLPAVRNLLSLYLNRFSEISGSMINCGPVLSWMEMDNRGHHLMVTDDSAINTPAIAAAHVTRRYNAQATDEISFEVGDIISIIDMPPPDETTWWRGKRGFEVGFFPSDHVEVIGNEIPQAMASKIPETPPKPVLRKRGKLISFLRLFFSNRPARSTLKRSGIVKERVFGCDLGEHLLNSQHDVPLVLKCCAEVIEKHGIVDGIYRLSGVASNIHKLRLEFDEDRVPDLMDEVYQQDIHSISSLLKMYFRELPNPLFTYQLYDKFAEAIQDEDQRLSRIHKVVQQLPPPHYRTAHYLISHLFRVSEQGHKTGMHCKNLAIVWAPNLLRSKDLESSCNAAALQGVGVQAIVTEFLITYADLIFNDKLPSLNDAEGLRRERPKSLAMSTPTKLLSLEEARQRATNVSSENSPKLKYIEVGAGPRGLPAKYHTVLDVPHYYKKKQRKERKPMTSSGWRSLFSKGRQQALKKQVDPTAPVSSLHMTSLADSPMEEDRRQLRSVKSADSLLSAPSNRSSQRRSNTGSSSDGTTYINPYAVADETGRASVSSALSQPPLLPPSMDERHQRSASYDYGCHDYEMERDMPSPAATDDGVFVLDAEMESQSLDGVSFYGGRSLPEEVLGNRSLAEEAYDIVYRSHMLNIGSKEFASREFTNSREFGTSRDSMNSHNVAREYSAEFGAREFGAREIEQRDNADMGSSRETLDSMDDSVDDNLESKVFIQGEMVPIVTRSHSMNLYEDSQEPSPRLSTFSGPPDNMYDVVEVQRSRSLGNELDLDLDKVNIPRSSTSSSSKSYNKLRSPTKSKSSKSSSAKSLKSGHTSPKSPPAVMPISPNSPPAVMPTSSNSPPSVMPTSPKSPPSVMPTNPQSINEKSPTSPKSPDSKTPTSPKSPKSPKSPSIKERIVQALSPPSRRRALEEITDTQTDMLGHNRTIPEAEQFIRNPHFLEKEQSPGYLAEKAAKSDNEVFRQNAAEAQRVVAQRGPEGKTYRDINMRGSEGAQCEMASLDNLSRGSHSLTTDSETNFQLGQGLSSSEGSSLQGAGEKKATPLASGMSLDSVEEESYMPLSPSKTPAYSAINLPTASQSRSSSVTRISKALSVPADLQRSNDELDSQCDMGSIGSFSELSRSLNSLLHDVESQDSYTEEQGISASMRARKHYSDRSVQADMTDSACSGITYTSSLAYSSSSESEQPGPARIYQESLLSPVQEHVTHQMQDFADEAMRERLVSHQMAAGLGQDSSDDDACSDRSSGEVSEPEVIHLSTEDLSVTRSKENMSHGLSGMTESQMSTGMMESQLSAGMTESQMSTDIMNMSSDSVTMRSDDELAVLQITEDDLRLSMDSQTSREALETRSHGNASEAQYDSESYVTHVSGGSLMSHKLDSRKLDTDINESPLTPNRLQERLKDSLPNQKDSQRNYVEKAPMASYDSTPTGDSESPPLSSAVSEPINIPGQPVPPSAAASRSLESMDTKSDVSAKSDEMFAKSDDLLTKSDDIYTKSDFGKDASSSPEASVSVVTPSGQQRQGFLSDTAYSSIKQTQNAPENSVHRTDDPTHVKTPEASNYESDTKSSDDVGLTVDIPHTEDKHYQGYIPSKFDILALSRSPDGRPRVSPRPNSAGSRSGSRPSSIGSRPSSAGSRPSSVGSETEVQDCKKNDFAEDGTVYHCARLFERHVVRDKHEDSQVKPELLREKSPTNREKTEEGSLKRDSGSRDADIDTAVQRDVNKEKDTPAAKRKRSVKELTCQFEASGSPPTEPPISPIPDIKFKPIVLQKPRVVSMKGVSKEESKASQPAATLDRSQSSVSRLDVKSSSPPRSELQVKAPPVAPKSPETKKKYESVSQRKDSQDLHRKESVNARHEMPPRTLKVDTEKSQKKVEIVSPSEQKTSKKRPSSDVGGDSSREHSEEKEGHGGTVRHLSAMFERRSSLRGTERPHVERSSSRQEKLNELEESAIYEDEFPSENVIKVRQLSQMFERQNSSSSEGRRSAERHLDDSQMSRSANWAAV